MKEKEKELNGMLGGTLITDKSEELVTINVIKGTPFSTVTKDDKTFIAMGRYRLSEEYNNIEDAEALVYNMEWEFILNVINCMIIENQKTNIK